MFIRLNLVCLITQMLIVLPLFAQQFVGIQKNDFINHYRVQQTMAWCWASSAEMVLSYQGMNLPQEVIVTKIKGIPIVAGGSPVEMIRSTNSVLYNNNNRLTVVSGQYVNGPPTPEVLHNHLKRKSPIILTYQNGPWSGHAVVLTGMDANVTSTGVVIHRFYVFDPFPFVQTMNMFGQTFLTMTDDLKYQALELNYIPNGPLHLYRQGRFIGMVSGMILVDASII